MEEVVQTREGYRNTDLKTDPCLNLAQKLQTTGGCDTLFRVIGAHLGIRGLLDTKMADLRDGVVIVDRAFQIEGNDKIYLQIQFDDVEEDEGLLHQRASYILRLGGAVTLYRVLDLPYRFIPIVQIKILKVVVLKAVLQYTLGAALLAVGIAILLLRKGTGHFGVGAHTSLTSAGKGVDRIA